MYLIRLLNELNCIRIIFRAKGIKANVVFFYKHTQSYLGTKLKYRSENTLHMLWRHSKTIATDSNSIIDKLELIILNSKSKGDQSSIIPFST